MMVQAAVMLGNLWTRSYITMQFTCMVIWLVSRWSMPVEEMLHVSFVPKGSLYNAWQHFSESIHHGNCRNSQLQCITVALVSSDTLASSNEPLTTRELQPKLSNVRGRGMSTSTATTSLPHCSGDSMLYSIVQTINYVLPFSMSIEVRMWRWSC